MFFGLVTYTPQMPFLLFFFLPGLYWANVPPVSSLQYVMGTGMVLFRPQSGGQDKKDIVLQWVGPTTLVHTALYSS
jgi:hypothetical protein